MKKNYILLLLCILASFFTNAQIVYEFNTDGDTEGWVKIASQTTSISVDGGSLIVGGDISNYGGAMTGDADSQINISDSEYDYLEIVIKNNTTIAPPANGNGNFQLMNYVSGGVAGNTATKTNFEVPADGEFHTLIVFIPATPAANNGTIANLGIRIKGNPPASQTFELDKVTIKQLQYTYNGFVRNPSFEDLTGELGGWSLTGSGVTVAISTDASSGSQALEYTYSQTIPSNPPTLFNNYRWDMDQGAINNIQEATITWDMKYEDNPNDDLVKVAPRWKMNIASGGNGDRITYGASKAATDTWATYSVTRTISTDCASVSDPVDGTNCFDSETYDNIELGMSARDGADGVKVIIDNLVTLLTGTSLGTEDIDVKDDLQISVYPNPATDIITINAPSRIIGIRAVNLLGQITMIQDGFSNTLDVSRLTSGVYILKIIQENGVVSSKRFVRE
ncbi:MAG: Uncharacterised protein [Flavobacterium sp. SCGC AAA160-P02]|nr:MAG: Uncharacterised protein [Flavobacterium sp. SCGC AAA160-P02]